MTELEFFSTMCCIMVGVSLGVVYFLIKAALTWGKKQK